MVEMTETANILHHATARSLVILDEIGRGTSTLDGLSLAWAITETLAARGACTLFATHYHELTQLADTLPSITNLHVSVREWNDEVVFLHKIVPGRTDRSYGIHVARLAGLPSETIARAKEVLELLGTVEVADALSGRVQQVASAPRARTAQPSAPQRTTPQLSLFTEYVEHPAVEELRNVDLNALTPLAAFDLLRRLADTARAR
jgi:DNA mismatch repair protein MutS